MPDRTRARALAAAAHAEGDAVGWFDTLYREAAAGRATVPWDDGAPSPLLVQALRGRDLRGVRALDVGTGFGDVAAWLAAQGAVVTAFDVSAAAVDAARRRFPDAPVAWAVADVRRPPAAWAAAFDLVVELNTLQTLPPEARAEATAALRGLVAPGGRLWLGARARGDGEPAGDFPFPLRRSEVEALAGGDLALAALTEVVDDEVPPVRRWVALFARPTPEEAVRSVLAAQVAAWNEGRLDAFCAGYADDVVMLHAGGVVRGRAALERDYARRYPDRAAMGTLSLEVEQVSAGVEQVGVVARWKLARGAAVGGRALLLFAHTPAGWRLTHDATLQE